LSNSKEKFLYKVKEGKAGTRKAAGRQKLPMSNSKEKFLYKVKEGKGTR
jgi:hypothetical protein